ncbi:hypothetical protein L1987_68244 [Smallanthus sonchifolius]|uniref:Uncharacterized protein n=1 Tax=Smallanthus sonchifolius TaxID=185202 RepID=A0ACB9B4Z4_9ASTR|nr:hypothetical protein L1987_68244 [Smallanthus sonchifolius]
MKVHCRYGKQGRDSSRKKCHFLITKVLRFASIVISSAGDVDFGGLVSHLLDIPDAIGKVIFLSSRPHRESSNGESKGEIRQIRHWLEYIQFYDGCMCQWQLLSLVIYFLGSPCECLLLKYMFDCTTEYCAESDLHIYVDKYVSKMVSVYLH